MKLKRVAYLIRSATPMPLRKLIRRTGGGGPPGFPSIEGALRTLDRLGLRPSFCVDVGAYHGKWTEMFRTIFPASRVLMIEAQETKRNILRQVVNCHPAELNMEIALLGSSDDRIVGFTEMETGSSVFAETSPYPRTTVKRTTCQLDTLLANGKYPNVDFLLRRPL